MTTPSGFVNYTPENIPAIPDEQKADVLKDYGKVSSSGKLRINKYTAKTAPIVSEIDLWGPGGYYMNGPVADPMDRAYSIKSQIDSYRTQFSGESQRKIINDFVGMVNKYGATNSPGTLYTMATMGVKPDTEVGTKLLKADAAAATENWVKSAPVTASSPSANNDEGWLDNFWKPIETVNRNLFAALSMPLEAIQGAVRSAGGALFDENLSPLERYGKSLLASSSLTFPPLALLGNQIYGDNEFVNPFEQTNFGQVLLAATTNGADAFTTMQAGLDVERAKQELLSQPEFAAAASSPEAMADLNDAAIQLAQEKGYYGEQGWFIEDTSRIQEAQKRQAIDAWALQGPNDETVAWTLGRGIFGAVGGPEWSGYGIASGVVDAAAAIFMDPLTYAPAGLISKAAKAASGGKVLFGTAKQQELARRATTYRSVKKFADAAGVKVEDLRDLDPQELAAFVAAGKKTELATEASKTLQFGEEYLLQSMADARRAAAQSFRATIPGAPTGDDAQRIQLWQEYLNASYINGEWRAGSNYAWRSSLMQDPEKYRLWDEMARDQHKIRKTLPDDRFAYDQAYLDVLNERTSRIARPVNIAADQVERDATRIYAEAVNPAGDVGMLQKFQYAGTVVADLPGRSKKNPAHAMTDGVESTAYYLGKRNLKTVPAKAQIPDEIRGVLRTSLMEILERPGMVRTIGGDTVVDSESLFGQTLTRVNDALDPRSKVQALLDNPATTYETLLQNAGRLGLDGFLDDILRQNQIDGIHGLDVPTGRGIWFGQHPEIVTYQINDMAKNTGMGFRNVGADIDQLLNDLDMTDVSVIRSDMGGRSIRELDQMRLDADGQIMTQSDAAGSFALDRLVDASAKQQALKAQIDNIDLEATNTEDFLKKYIAWQAGLRYTNASGVFLDEKGVRSFLFGLGPESNFANRTLDALARFIPQADINRAQAAGKYQADGVTFTEDYEEVITKAIGELYEITKGHWDDSTYRAVAENALNGGGREGLLAILAPRMGVDITKGSISRTTKLMDGDGKNYFRTWRTAHPRITRALGQMPAARKVGLNNSSDVADAVVKYGRYAGIDEEFINKQVGRVMLHADSIGNIAINRNVLADTFDAISDRLVEGIENADVLFKGVKGLARKTELITAMRSSTRLWVGGEAEDLGILNGMSGYNAAVSRIINEAGESLDLPDIMLDTELAQGYVNLPSVDEWSKALNRVSTAIARYESVDQVREVARRFFDNFFRASMLAFRIAYIIRNSAEMQVRMFLSGHDSVFNDPATMVGMTIGNFMDARGAAKYARKREQAYNDLMEELGRPPKPSEVDERVGTRQDFFSKAFAPYRETVLGTDFEVGLDEQLALANHVEDYYALIRMAHSLTDPRVYNQAVRQGWRNVGFGQPSFNQGWAHELIMLERSGIARNVLKYHGGGLQSSGVDRVDEGIAWFMGDSDEARNIRKLMAAADPKFSTVFSDPEYLRQFLFTGPNSIMNRIRKYTNADPTLENYIRTGVLEYGTGQRLALKSIPDANQRLRQFAGVLQENYNGPQWQAHFTENAVSVPYLETFDKTAGISLINKFFQFSNKIERLGSVGPEYRMAYWDKIAELAPGLRVEDLDRALKAARTTLSPIKRMNAEGKFDNIGRNHPAFSALAKAKGENVSGAMTLDELHEIANAHAAEVVGGLFYDASKRNNTWYALRLLFPFGQAWGNTVTKWAELGAKRPLQIYKAEKALNALMESGSSAIYTAGQSMGMYGQYAPGFAPWDQDVNGGFFYTDQFGETSFMYPYAGQLAGATMRALGMMHGIVKPSDVINFETGEIPLQSPATSLNLALGGDSIFPGVGPLGAMPLATGVLPDWEVVSRLRQIAAPFGEKDIIENAVPAWFAKVLSGAESIPLIGGVVGSYVDSLAPANKNKAIRDAMMILSSSGNYADWGTNPETARKLRDDAAGLSAALLLTTGLFQSVMPSTPIATPATQIAGDEFKGEMENTGLYTVSLLNSFYQQYRERHGFDDTAAREEWVRDFGPAALFATIGDWKNLSRVPTSEAMKFARSNPEIAKAYPDEFTLFYPGGDSSDVAAIAWIRKYGKGDRERKNKDEVYGEVVGFLERVQRERINSLEANGLITEASAEAARDDLESRYVQTGDVARRVVDKTAELAKIKAFYDKYDVVQQSNAGQGFRLAWSLREATLERVREATGRDSVTLRGKKVAPLKDWYVEQINLIEQQYPDFKLLAGKFRREFD